MAELVEAILDWELVPVWEDVGATTFMVLYADGKNRKRDIKLSACHFKSCYSLIKRLIPDREPVPAVLTVKAER